MEVCSPAGFVQLSRGGAECLGCSFVPLFSQASEFLGVWGTAGTVWQSSPCLPGHVERVPIEVFRTICFPDFRHDNLRGPQRWIVGDYQWCRCIKQERWWHQNPPKMGKITLSQTLFLMLLRHYFILDQEADKVPAPHQCWYKTFSLIYAFLANKNINIHWF